MLRSMKCNFKAGLSSGAAQTSLYLDVTESRALTPHLSLNYHSNQGNGPFGIGFSLSGVVSISRDTTHHLPYYDDRDQFILNSVGLLVEVERTKTCIKYRPRYDHTFIEVEYYLPKKTWLVRQADGINHYLGENEESLLINPNHGDKVFSWSVSRSQDSKGNKIVYHYEQEEGKKYLSKINYGNYNNAGAEHFAFEICFNYGSASSELDIDGKHLWQAKDERPDQFSRFNLGFKQTTKRLCHEIVLYHNFKGQKLAKTVNKFWRLCYDSSDAQVNAISTLQSIVEIGCRSNDDGRYLLKPYPETSFKYAQIAEDDLRMQPFTLPGNSKLPGISGQYQWFDLYGEGLSGIIYSDTANHLYWRSKGNGEFYAPQPIDKMPSQFNFGDHQCRIMPLINSYEVMFVASSGPQANFYLLDKTSTKQKTLDDEYQLSWTSGGLIKRFTTAFNDPNNKTIDISGRRSQDLLVLDHYNPHYYLSDGTHGYKKPQPLKLPKDFPKSHTDINSYISFLDIFGDGLSHRIKVTSEGVDVWPNLGHGVFGNKIRWILPKIKGDFDARRLYFSDMDGSGAADLIYAYKDHIEVFINHGRGYKQTPLQLKLPEQFSFNDQLLFGDLLGKGVASVLFIKNNYAGASYYHGSFANQKPYLLNEISNGLGQVTFFKYISSVAQQNESLEMLNANQSDQQPILKGERLPFVMSVLQEKTVVDTISNTRSTEQYTYYQGYYDHIEKRFCGFGYVESRRLPSNHAAVEATEVADEVCDIGNVEGALIKSWYYTGESLDREQQYNPENLNQWVPENVNLSQPELMFALQDEGLKKQAGLALQNHLWRKEVWPLDSNALTPMQVSCNVFVVKPIEAEEAHHIIFTTALREKWDLQFECTDEPRIMRQTNLEFDAYNNILRTLKTFYGRRVIDPKIQGVQFQLSDGENSDVSRLQPLQQQTRILLSHHSFAVKTEENAHYCFKHVVAAHLAYDLTDGALREIGDLASLYKLSEKYLEQQLCKHQCYFYWDDALTNAAPLGEFNNQPLLHHTEDLLGTQDHVDSWYSDILDNDSHLDSVLSLAGYICKEKKDLKYLSTEIQKEWWRLGKVAYYDAKSFFQIFCITHHPDLIGHMDQSGYHRHVITFDEYQLKVLSLIEYYSNGCPRSTTFRYDYQAYRQWCTTDINGNKNIAVYDPIGMPIATTKIGYSETTVTGNLIVDSEQAIISADNFNVITCDLIQSVCYKDLDSLVENQTELLGNWVQVKASGVAEEGVWYLLSLSASDFTNNADSFEVERSKKIYTKIDYLNGSGKVLQSMRQINDCSWHCSGLIVEDPFGYLLAQYLPFNCKQIPQGYHTDDKVYQFQNKSSEVYQHSPLLNFYDASGRSQKQILPSKHQRQTFITPWYQICYDENVISKQQGEQNISGAPEVIFTDSLGSPCGQLKHQQGKNLLNTTVHDALGRPVAHQDARLKQNNLKIRYNLLNQAIQYESVDRGLEVMLHNQYGSIVRRSHGDWLYEDKLDTMQRVVFSYVRHAKPGGEKVKIASYKYGEQLLSTKQDPKANNLLGKLIEKSNQDGVVQYQNYDLSGCCTEYHRKIFLETFTGRLPSLHEPRVCRSFHDEGGELFKFKDAYNITGNCIANMLPDGSIYRHTNNRLAQVASIDQIHGVGRNELHKLEVSSFAYNAAGFRNKIKRGKIETNLHYSPITQRLECVDTVRNTDLKVLHDLSYGYDPVGNVTSVGFGNVNLGDLRIPATQLNYSYDNLYRITHADGLELLTSSVTPDAQHIPSAYPDRATKLQKYSQQFLYDASNNLVGVKHHHHQAAHKNWNLKFQIAENSNRLSDLTKVNNNKPLGINEAAIYDATGNMKKTTAEDDLTWGPGNQLKKASTMKRAADGTVTQVEEHYGYQGPNNINFKDKLKYSPSERTPENMASIATRHQEKGRGDVKPIAQIGHRLYKATIFKDEAGVTVIEQLFLGAYEVKRVYHARLGEAITPAHLILERRSHRLKDINNDQHFVSYHYWTLDRGKVQASALVPIEAPSIITKADRQANKISYQWCYHLTDRLNHAVLDITPEGELLAFEQFQPYGATAFIIVKNNQQLRFKDYHFSSKVKDQATGLYYFGARYYSPQYGRWLSPDPAGLVDGLNLFAIVRGNPITFFDLWGCEKNPETNMFKPTQDLLLPQFVEANVNVAADIIYDMKKNVPKTVTRSPGMKVFQRNASKGKQHTKAFKAYRSAVELSKKEARLLNKPLKIALSSLTKLINSGPVKIYFLVNDVISDNKKGSNYTVIKEGVGFFVGAGATMVALTGGAAIAPALAAGASLYGTVTLIADVVKTVKDTYDIIKGNDPMVPWEPAPGDVMTMPSGKLDLSLILPIKEVYDGPVLKAPSIFDKQANLFKEQSQKAPIEDKNNTQERSSSEPGILTQANDFINSINSLGTYYANSR